MNYMKNLIVTKLVASGKMTKPCVSLTLPTLWDRGTHLVKHLVGLSIEIEPNDTGLSLTIEKKIKDLMRSWIEVVPVLFISSRKNSNSLALETITEEEARDREDDK
ncbi:hypothetical protein SADUNF_Sadunf03G0031400 [Salix dunnii]|uniref:Uncharacterized protein n=1 Tax=Salix dunnii TaxID=1413687 RepID=A0A835KGY0_9ROSI|nr:hypothetical protein SADUNF_Sadunf03G0031400 [Salix dunnii]